MLRRAASAVADSGASEITFSQSLRYVILPQVRGEAGSPRETIFCHYEPRHGKNTTKTRYAQDKRWKLYQDGRLYDLATDELEKTPVTSASAESGAARTKLQAALDRMERDVPFGK